MEFEHDKTWKMQSTVAALILVCCCGICILAIRLVQAIVTYFQIHPNEVRQRTFLQVIPFPEQKQITSTDFANFIIAQHYCQKNVYEAKFTNVLPASIFLLSFFM